MIQETKVGELQGLSSKKKLFLMFALTMFFFAISDGIVSFLIPVVMTNSGLSPTAMGILYASSSGFGAVFDFVLSKVLRSTNYKRVYFYAILLLLAIPFLIFTSTAVWIFLIGMAVQGLYINLASYGIYDFVAREGAASSHTSSFAFLGVFADVGYAIGPIMATQFFVGSGAVSPLILLSILILISGSFFVSLILSTSKKKEGIVHLPTDIAKREHVEVSLRTEIWLWLRVSKKLWPLLLLGISLAMMESIFWTVTPLIDRLSGGLHGLGGIIMAVSLIPSLFINWSAGPITARFGKKRTAYVSFLLCNLVLFAVGYTQNPYVIILLIFVSSLLEAIAFPAIGGAFADYLHESKSYDNEIVTTKSFIRNIGFMIGPIIGGFLLERVANLTIFSYVAVYGIIVSIILIVFSPATIDFHDRNVMNAYKRKKL